MRAATRWKAARATTRSTAPSVTTASAAGTRSDLYSVLWLREATHDRAAQQPPWPRHDQSWRARHADMTPRPTDRTCWTSTDSARGQGSTSPTPATQAARWSSQRYPRYLGVLRESSDGRAPTRRHSHRRGPGTTDGSRSYSNWGRRHPHGGSGADTIMPSTARTPSRRERGGDLLPARRGERHPFGWSAGNDTIDGGADDDLVLGGTRR